MVTSISFKLIFYDCLSKHPHDQAQQIHNRFRALLQKKYIFESCEEISDDCKDEEYNVNDDGGRCQEKRSENQKLCEEIDKPDGQFIPSNVGNLLHVFYNLNGNQ